MIKVVVAEDHSIVRRVICDLLGYASDIEVVGEAADGRRAVDLVARLRPDVVIMDIEMPALNGIDALKQIREQGLTTAVVMLSMYTARSIVEAALSAGANGFVRKRVAGERLLEAVRAVIGGERYLCPELKGASEDEVAGEV